MDIIPHSNRIINNLFHTFSWQHADVAFVRSDRLVPIEAYMEYYG